MSLIKFQRSPLSSFSGVNRLADVHDELIRLFNSPFDGSENSVSAWAPALDVYEEKDNYTVKIELAGVNKEDVKLSLEKGTLTVSGERKVETKKEGTEVYYSERFHGRFQRTISLPETIATDKVTAQYKDGILTVTLPKSEAAKPKQIDITLN